ncbi:MAG: fructose-6-phosphate aldolase [Desulfarculaceae bacterium]|nr:fructose-6-phosphate aldolase [Desulfarculaceae bacterium]MCF8073469.1 fructose-6-phosphate aldolase [Desulfarculaceae bacterium]MCF8100384.1 fructose-6-phosphate aldolase [Desulfarculaceae bacterium]MCF8115880.1 fructose-6-phosphate aldolase [Desulfarculaceae bacterium]
MKIFIDTADIEEIKQAQSLGVLDGVTTNPSLVAKTGKPFETCIKEILEVVPGDVSVEVVGLTHDEMVAEAEKYAAWGDNVVIKVPIIEEGLKAIKTLSGQGVKVNVTLCFSPLQALLAAKAGATYISPFVGRLDDIHTDGMELISQIVDIYGNYAYDTEVLVASIRNPMHVVSAALMGADVCTIPYKVIGQLLKHPLTDKGLAAFLADWEKANKG